MRVVARDSGRLVLADDPGSRGCAVAALAAVVCCPVGVPVLVTAAHLAGLPTPSWVDFNPAATRGELACGAALWAVTVLGTAMFVLSLAARQTILSFDASTGRFAEERRLWNLHSRRIATIPLDEIEGARVLVHADADGVFYGVELVLMDGQTRSIHPVVDRERARKDEMAALIDAFLREARATIAST